MEALPKILQTGCLEVRAWPAETAPLADPAAVKTYALTGGGEELQVTLVVHAPLERLVLAVRPAFVPAIRLSQGPTGPWEEAVAWEGCAAGEQRVFLARRQDGGRWRGAAPASGEGETADRYAAWFTAETAAGTP